MNVLFICTGNTCRSPFAAAVARRETEGLGGWDFESAGLRARAGDLAPGEASAAAAEWRLDLSHHQARPLTAELLDWADVLVAMTAAQAAALRERAGPEKVRALRAGDLEDPIGRGLNAYRRVYGQIETAVRRLLVDLEPGRAVDAPLGGEENPPATRGERIAEKRT